MVPCISFGDHELWDQGSNAEGTFARRFQDFMMKWIGITLPLFHGRGIFQYSYGLLPKRRPIHFVGRLQYDICDTEVLAEDIFKCHDQLT